MDKNFNEYYIEANITVPDNDILEKRWLAVEKLANKVDKEDIVNLCLSFFGFEMKEEFLEYFCDTFKEYDSSFSKNSNIEIRLLCGVILLQIAQVRNATNSTYLVEIIIQAAKFSNNRALADSIINEINNCYNIDTNNIRNMEVDRNSIKQVKKPTKLIAKLTGNTWDEDAFNLFKEYISATQSTLDIMKSKLDSFEQLQDLRNEESQLLWWLTTGWSETKESPYKTIDSYNGSFRVGYEISQFVRVFPGPSSVQALIQKMIEQCKESGEKISFGDIIQNSPKDISIKIIESSSNNPLLRLLPITMALNESKDTEELVEWSNKLMRCININGLTEIKFTPEQIAEQLYYELLALKCYECIIE